MSEQVDNKAEEQFLRMTKNERIQHFLLLSSFMVLILTGFWLKFPEAFWVKWIVFVIGENAFEARGIIHRVASVVMIGASVYHLFYILFSKRGRKLVKDFFPYKQDIIDFKNSMLYLVGKSDEKPKLGRFSYMEKMEYWAVIWGTVIMGATGSILWFENIFLKYVSTTGMDIATAIHYYEAILASLAILVWHFYFIFLNPDIYPMNKVWFKGYLTREEMENEHPLELEELDRNEAKSVEDTKEDSEVIAEDDVKEESEAGVKEKSNEKVSAERTEKVSKEQ